MSDKRRVDRGHEHIGYVYWDNGGSGYGWEMQGIRSSRFFGNEFEAEENLIAAFDRNERGIPLAPGGYDADPDGIR